jgi:hypothetical protein
LKDGFETVLELTFIDTLQRRVVEGVRRRKILVGGAGSKSREVLPSTATSAAHQRLSGTPLTSGRRPGVCDHPMIHRVV